jgi:hypothetical protein
LDMRPKVYKTLFERIGSSCGIQIAPSLPTRVLGALKQLQQKLSYSGKI